MDKKKIIASIIGLLVVITAAGSAFWQARVTQQMANTPAATGTAVKSTASSSSKSASKSTVTPTSFTLAEVATHSGASSCWTVINGSVYDLTKWIAQHPGGEGAILSICGQDGSDAFNNQHGGQGRPEQVLATFRIGALVN